MGYPPSAPGPSSTMHRPSTELGEPDESSSEAHRLGLYPPPYTPYNSWKSHDPRSSSTQSLVPSLNDHNENRRTLLIVYIHGFMGNDSSFQSFPAHVHHYLKASLAETHVIHTKIYPRYKTYKAIGVAKENFSKWLEPHESETTDVILIGHSMGGLLAADVVLQPSSNPVYGYPFRHRILGTISLDAPLLGLHPGIVVSGISSLFRKAPDPPGKQQELGGNYTTQSNASGSISPPYGSPSLSPDPSIYSEISHPSGVTSPDPWTSVSSITSSQLTNNAEPDPYFNPPFYNDVKFVDRGWWRNVAHFAKKHQAEGVFNSAYNHIVSHLEFGSCLADYPALNNRYNKLRALEDVDDFGPNINGPSRQSRVRFVNYFTISTGIPKKSSTLKRADTHLKPATAERPGSVDAGTGPGSGTSTPRISVEDYSDSERPTLLQLDPIPEPDNDEEKTYAKKGPEPGNGNGELNVSQSSNESTASNTTLVPEKDADVPTASTEETTGDGTSQPLSGVIELKDANSELSAMPPLPELPQTPDLDRFTDKEARKQAEKEGKRAQKAYQQAVKNRDKAVKERQKLIEKWQKKAIKEAEKREKEEQKRRTKEEQKRIAREEREQEQKRVALEKEEQVQVQTLQKRLTEVSMQDPEADLVQPSTDKGKGQDKRKEEKKKERKFCMLPRKVNGARDSAWVEIYMKDVDEVGAHCGLFFPGPHYEKLIGEVGSRIVDWVHDDASKRAILASQ